MSSLGARVSLGIGMLNPAKFASIPTAVTPRLAYPLLMTEPVPSSNQALTLTAWREGAKKAC